MTIVWLLWNAVRQFAYQQESFQHFSLPVAVPNPRGKTGEGGLSVAYRIFGGLSFRDTQDFRLFRASFARLYRNLRSYIFAILKDFGTRPFH